MELFCHSHHLVYRDGEDWVKQPRDTSARARAEIERDGAVHRALGRPVTTLPGGAITLPHLGQPLTHERPTLDLDEIDNALTAIHRVQVAPSILLSTSDWLGHTREKVDERLTSRPAVRAWCHRALDSLGPAPHSADPGLSLADPHPGNWCRDQHGQLQPLDFETACWADLALSQACLRHYAFTTDLQPPRDHGDSTDNRGRWYFSVKAVSGLSWLALARAEQIPARTALLERCPWWAGH